MRAWVFLAGAILAEVTGTLSMKGAIEHPALYVLMAAGYATAFVFLSLTLRSGLPLGIAYGIWGAAGVALTAAASALLFGEPITLIMALGIVCIMGGVILVEAGHRGQALPTVAVTEADYDGAATDDSDVQRGDRPPRRVPPHAAESGANRSQEDGS